MDKLKTINQLAEIAAAAKKRGKTVGLITGCFDILHLGHINLFEFAKKKVDILVVGVESDATVKLNKGVNHPFFNQQTRMKMLASLEDVDYVFKIGGKVRFIPEIAEPFYAKITQKIKPTVLITGKEADKSWKIKKQRVEKQGIGFIGYYRRGNEFSSRLIKLLEENL